MKGTSYDPLGSLQQASSPTSATVVQITVPTETQALLMGAETTDARVTFDGTTPTAAVGLIVKAGQQPILVPLNGANPKLKVQMCSSAGTASILDVQPLS